MNKVIKSTSQLVSAFFTHPSEQVSEYRKSLFDQIHDIVFYGKGGYDFHTVYNLPIWLRKYTHKQIFEYYKQEKDSIKKAQSKDSNSKTVIDTEGNVQLPEFLKKAKKFTAK